MSPAAALVARMRTVSNAEELGGWPGICAAEVEALRAEEIVGQRKGRWSAPLVCPVTRGNVDLIQVAISFGFAEDRAMLAFEVDPGDGEPKFFGVTAERDGDRIADRDPGWQADVVIGPAGAGHDPTATFGQHTWAPRCYRLDGIGLISSSRAETASGNQEARNPDTKWHGPSPIECDMLKSALAIAAFQPMRACKCAATGSVKMPAWPVRFDACRRALSRRR